MVDPRLFAGGSGRKWVFPRQGCSVRSEQGISLTPEFGASSHAGAVAMWLSSMQVTAR